MFVIVVDYYFADPEEKKDYITKPMYLGIDNPPFNVYVFDDVITERTKKFSTETEAILYLSEHDRLYTSICYENLRIVER